MTPPAAPRRTLLSIARRAGIRIGYPCRGEGVCGKCAVEILEGADLLLPPSEAERALLEREGIPHARISCLALPRGPGTILLRVGGGSWRVVIKR
ncbi:MAG TPA: 2Fe-2S iron-sulfur cluster-binding protein [Vulgatibacter sp.]